MWDTRETLTSPLLGCVSLHKYWILPFIPQATFVPTHMHTRCVPNAHIYLQGNKRTLKHTVKHLGERVCSGFWPLSRKDLNYRPYTPDQGEKKKHERWWSGYTDPSGKCKQESTCFRTVLATVPHTSCHLRTSSPNQFPLAWVQQHPSQSLATASSGSPHDLLGPNAACAELARQLSLTSPYTPPSQFDVHPEPALCNERVRSEVRQTLFTVR